MKMHDYTPWMKHFSVKSPIITGTAMTDYFNREEVRYALNIPPEAPKWEACVSRNTEISTIKYIIDEAGSFWIYPILKNKIRILFFSGDTDGAVTTTGSKRWIKELNWDVVESWRPWFYDN